MSKYLAGRFWLLWTAGVVLTALVLATGGYYLLQNANPESAHAGEARSEEESPEVPQVELVRPQKGGMNRTTTQPGSVKPFQWADLYAEVNGYLKEQLVDINDHVTKGQVLAVLDVPDLQAQLERREADLKRAEAVVVQARARVKATQAVLEEAKAQVVQAEATRRSTEAALRYRESYYQRMKDLLAERSVAAQVVDEERERRDAALEAMNAAVAAVVTAKAKVVAVMAKIDQARADVDAAQADVGVAQAERDNARVQVGFATIRAPAKYDGIVTLRSMHVSDFVRSASSGAAIPLFKVERTDLFRVVVLVPDRDVPYLEVGDPATIDLNALPGTQFHARVSRMADSEDPQTRLMRVEIDLPNQDGRIKAGMFGNVTIILNKSELITLPSSAVVNRKDNGMADVFVVRKGRLRRRVVFFGNDNGILVAIRSGVTPGEEVVLNPQGLEEGQSVTVAGAETTRQAAAPGS